MIARIPWIGETVEIELSKELISGGDTAEFEAFKKSTKAEVIKKGGALFETLKADKVKANKIAEEVLIKVLKKLSDAKAPVIGAHRK